MAEVMGFLLPGVLLSSAYSSQFHLSQASALVGI